MLALEGMPGLIARALGGAAPAPPNIVFVLTDDQRWDTTRSSSPTSSPTPRTRRWWRPMAARLRELDPGWTGSAQPAPSQGAAEPDYMDDDALE